MLRSYLKTDDRAVVQAARAAKSDQALVRSATQSCYMLSIEAEKESGDWDASWCIVDESAQLHSSLWRSRTRITDRWTNLAEVFDYADAIGQPTLYINGKMIGDARIGIHEVDPPPLLNKLYIGAQEPSREHFQGSIREARISRGMKYIDSFTPPNRLEAKSDTIVLIDFASDNGKQSLDLSGNGNFS